MTRAEREARDEELVKRYQAGEKPTKLAGDYGITVSAVFLILKRTGTSARTGRYSKFDRRRFDPQTSILINTGFCTKPDKAHEFLRMADYYQQNPHRFELSQLGLTVNKLKQVNDALHAVQAYVTYTAPFYVYFSTKNAFLPLTYRQLILFAAQPFAHIMERRADVVVLNAENLIK